MEPGYLHLNWNHIRGMYLRKYYLRTLIIEKEEWAHLSNPTSLTHYWEPTQGSGDFHRTFAFALCRTAFHDCEDTSWRKEYVVSVAVVQKLAWYMVIFQILRWLRSLSYSTTGLAPSGFPVVPWCILRPIPSSFYDHAWLWEALQCGSPPQKFMGALLHNAFQAGDKPSPKAKLPPAFLDHPTKFPIHSRVQDYQDWTTNCNDRTPPEKHFVWLSN